MSVTKPSIHSFYIYLFNNSCMQGEIISETEEKVIQQRKMVILLKNDSYNVTVLEKETV